MSIHSASPIIRRKSRKIWVGNVPVGGDAPIAVQSMTNTETCDVAATVAQIRRLEDAGADIVRVSVPDMDAAEAFGKIKQQVNVPLVADIHFDYRIALRVAEAGSGLPAHQSGQHRSRGPGQGRGRRRARAQHPDPYRRQCRFAGKGPAEEIRRTDPGSPARIGHAPRRSSRQAGLPELQGQRQGLRRLHGRRRLSPAGQADRAAPAPGHHRGRRPALRHGEVGGGAGHAPGRGNRRHHPDFPGCRSGRGDQGRFRHPQVPAPALPWHQLHRLPEPVRGRTSTW